MKTEADVLEYQLSASLWYRVVLIFFVTSQIFEGIVLLPFWLLDAGFLGLEYGINIFWPALGTGIFVCLIKEGPPPGSTFLSLPTDIYY